MKNFKKLMFLVAVVVTALVCFAFSVSALEPTGQCGDAVYWEYDSTTGELVISGTGAMTDYQSYNGSPFYDSNIKSVVINNGVTTIGAYAFRSCRSLTVVTIPDSVTTIGDYAFCCCYSLTDVDIGDNVTTIGDSAFICCNSLTDIRVDKNNQYFSNDEYGVLFNKNKTTLIQYPIGNKRTDYTIPDKVTTIGYRAFYSCDSLTVVTIPDSVTTIGNYSFYYCENLTSITIPHNVKTIGDYAFYRCENFTSIIIPDSVKTIGDYAFSGDPLSESNLKSVIIGDGVTEIGDYAFSFCFDLKSVEVGDSVKIIGDSAFECCESLTSITLPDSVTTIGASAFFDCYSLTEVTIPDSVTTIGKSAFSSCYSLTEVTIPDSVTTIGDYAFSGCSKLTDVYYGGTQEQWKKIKIGSYNGDLTSANIHYTCCHINKTTHAQQNPTCTEKGYTEGVKCADCEKWIEGHNEIPATNHPNKKLKSQQDATCITVGYTAGTYCPDCRKWIEGHKEIPSKGHTFTEKIIDSKHLKSKATVEKAAIYKYDCANCDTISSSKTFSYGKPLTLGTISKLTAVPGETSVALSWNKAENATGYRVYYKLAGDLNWRVCISYTTKTTYIFDDLPSGEYYKFAVKSLYKKSDGKYISGGHKELQTSTQPLAPTTITATQTTSTITLNWSACKGATGYRVYQYSPSKGKYVQIASLKGKTTYTKSKNLKAGSQYKFKIKPYVKLSDGTVIWGSASSAFTTATKPVPPTKITATTTSSAISLKWTASAGATGYRVYQHSPSKGKYVQIASVKGTTSYKKSKNLKAGTTYKFKVKPYVKLADGTVIWGKASGEFAFKTKA